MSDDKVYCNDDAYSVMNNCYGSKIYAEGTYNGYWIDNKANGEGYWQGVEDYSYKGNLRMVYFMDRESTVEMALLTWVNLKKICLMGRVSFLIKKIIFPT